MTIRRGEPWGSEALRPADLLVLDSDAALASAVERARPRSGGPDQPLSVSGGDLHRSLGAPADREVMQLLPIDLLHVVADGRRLVAVAHVIARRSWWRGTLLAASNVDHVGAWKVAPRAHPNDGKIHTVEVSPDMRVRDRWMARSRLPQGTHVPHPQISVSSAAEVERSFTRPLDLWVDGVAIGRVTDLSVSIEPDAFQIHI